MTLPLGFWHFREVDSAQPLQLLIILKGEMEGGWDVGDTQTKPNACSSHGPSRILRRLSPSPPSTLPSTHPFIQPSIHALFFFIFSNLYFVISIKKFSIIFSEPMSARPRAYSDRRRAARLCDPVYLPIHPSAHVSNHPSSYLPICPSTDLPIYPEFLNAVQ